MTLDDLIPDTDLKDVAELLGQPVCKLLEQSRAGTFPPILTLRRGQHRMWKKDLQSWLEHRWTTPAGKRPKLRRMPRSERVG